MGFKMGMFSYFNSVDLDGSGFLEEDEVACKLYFIIYRTLKQKIKIEHQIEPIKIKKIKNAV